jgi:hypothetical protein
MDYSIFYDDVLLENSCTIDILLTTRDGDCDLFTVRSLEEDTVAEEWTICYGSFHHMGIEECPRIACRERVVGEICQISGVGWDENCDGRDLIKCREP